jgi:hypothetical protein
VGYSDLPIIEEYDVTCARNYGQTAGIPAELLSKLLIETRFRMLDPEPGAESPEQGEAIGLRKIACPWCGWNPAAPNSGNGYTVLLAIEGIDTGVQILRSYPCRCKFYERLYSRWSGPNAMVPRAYRRFRLDGLIPSEKSILTLDDQADIIAEIQSYPAKNYLFIGPAKTGKTVFTTALFGWALMDWAKKTWNKPDAVDAVWRIVTADYLQQEHDYIRERERKVVEPDGTESYAKAKEPVVTRQKVKDAANAGLTPRLFLEEIDKIPDLTAFRSSNLFGLINEVYEQGGQLVVNSNKNVEALKKLFGPDNGEALLRRFTNDDDSRLGQTLDFFTWLTNHSEP